MKPYSIDLRKKIVESVKKGASKSQTARNFRVGRSTVRRYCKHYKRVREMIEGRGCKLLYLPPYSPDFNAIQETFSKIKGFLRQIGARTGEALVEAVGRALDTVTARDDAQGFFGYCGYHLPGQPL